MTKLQEQQDGLALIQMYQAGFLDAMRSRYHEKAALLYFRANCKKQFDLRYGIKLGKKIKKCLNKK
jgi:hypothetical protein